MRSTISLSRALSLRVPIASETERAQFQSRLALTLFIVFGMSFGFFALQVGLVAALAPEQVPRIVRSESSLIQLANTFGAVGLALYLRRGKPSAATLGALDIISTLTMCTVWAVMILCDEEGREPNIQLVALLATSYTLATRAALLPSTPGRSGLLGLAGMAPLLPVAYFLQNAVRPGAGLGAVIYMATWAVVGIACTTAISHVIYGLRLQVRQAMQLGQYLLEEKIGEGGMGVVYRASHAMLRRPCAIKLLSHTTGHAANRFEREVQITAQLTHPNTVVVFDYGRTPEGAFYYAMEYLDGITLEDLVLEFGPQPPARVAHVLLQMCGALDEAHAHGLVHRDIKPSNVMLTERGRVLDTVKVLDFGLVRESAQIDNGVSSVNSILGTPHYMAPEAILDPTSVDARTDLYAVGATAYFLLTGEHVFNGKNLVEVCSQHVHQSPLAPSEKRLGIPTSLDDVVLACLAKKPDDRPADAAALAQRIRSCKVDEWTSSDARAFWDQPAAKRSGARTKVGSTTSREGTELGSTVAIALEGRGAA
jgi:eukaryotic-like serine/threonine-protein kinase